MTVWFDVECRRCSARLLAPAFVAERVASGRSFVLCDRCGEAYELETGEEPVGRFDQVIRMHRPRRSS